MSEMRRDAGSVPYRRSVSDVPTDLHSCNAGDIEMQCPLISVKLRVGFLSMWVHD